ncbi:Ubiquinone/menaquinone biosynthesis protein [Hyella patelloides LEGE 07179]|uniref:Ubiquinone/menaquinone biosynthesis protein n=1 Tax=Hyella patelloides LEGE 07179 TaxID=945734 RepID=A0A563VML5_9CYAN|nr:class I SAM-dependent methyltransferase [Hyella patelloides]VEP12696.1 Ubiquinone/menaquinone biosynthesis protein [Hyella patelloides LEGE 07179]
MKQTYERLNTLQHSSETDPFTIERYHQFFKHLPKKIKNILDVGCNTGRGGETLKKLNPNLTIFGLDCVESRLQKLSSKIYEQKICSYSTNIPIENNYLDAIVAGEFIEHLYEKDVHQTLLEFYRTLKSQGRLLLTTPNPDYLRLKLTGGSVLGGAHVSEHYPNLLKEQLKTIGFTSIKILGSGKMSRLLGENFPFLTLYGSYIAIADKI